MMPHAVPASQLYLYPNRDKGIDPNPDLLELIYGEIHCERYWWCWCVACAAYFLVYVWQVKGQIGRAHV